MRLAVLNLSAALSLATIVTPLPALAQAHLGNHADCKCRAHGVLYDYGETTCLQMPNGPRLATCIMTQNVTSWDVSKAPCGTS